MPLLIFALYTVLTTLISMTNLTIYLSTCKLIQMFLFNDSRMIDGKTFCILIFILCLSSSSHSMANDEPDDVSKWSCYLTVTIVLHKKYPKINILPKYFLIIRKKNSQLVKVGCNIVQRCDKTNIDVLGLRGLKY